LIVSPNAGVAGELVRDQQNGFVCDLDVDAWAAKAVALLSNPVTYRRFSEASSSLVRAYTYRDAVDGLIAACRHAQGAPRAVMQTTGK
jgi:glycosyltransferase involved in cell wall biosynthesis